MRKHQIPSTNNQIITKIPMTEILNKKQEKRSFGYWILNNWDLFGVWNLVFGI